MECKGIDPLSYGMVNIQGILWRKRAVDNFLGEYPRVFLLFPHALNSVFTEYIAHFPAEHCNAR
jgi:hypothetical protein